MILKTKSYEFSLLIVAFIHRLQKEEKEFILSKQLLRSGTAIGALIREAEFAESKADFAHKMSIALKEANETMYWLNLIKDSGIMCPDEKLFQFCEELIAMLVSSIKTVKQSLKKR